MYVEENLLEKSLAYWKNELSELPDLEMVLDKERAPVLSSDKDCVDFTIPATELSALKDVCITHGCNLRVGLVAVYAACMCRHTTQTDVSIGHKVLNKNNPNYEVAILLEYNGSHSFADYLKTVEGKVTKAYANGNVTYKDLTTALNLQPDSRRNLIYQTMFNYFEDPDLPFDSSYLRNICEFILDAQDTKEGGLACKLYYSTALYERPTAERFAGHFGVLLKEIAKAPTAALDSLQMLSDEEFQEYMTWNTTDTDFGAFTRVDRMFEQMAAQYPNNEALRLDGQAMTFREVNGAADDIASKLFAKGVENGEKVGLVLDRSFDMFIAILAVAKVGGIIVPIDIAHTPMDRIEYMFSDSSVRFVIIHDVHEIKLVDICSKFTMLSWSALVQEQNEEMYYRAAEVDRDTEAVFGIFYTSGTTGRPKGVMNMHRNVFNLVKAFSKYFSIQPTDRIIQFASYSFIQSLRQIWPTLCSGACLVLVRNPLLFGDVINAEKVNKMVITASALSMLNPTKHPTLKAIQLGGEAVPLKLAQSWNKQVKFMVGLGPTELTAHACCNPNVQDKVDIGTPHDNVRCYITNSKLQLQPKGCVGELCIAGQNVAKGYLNLPDATREKFIQNPYVTKTETFYKTGDLAMRNRFGMLEFIGRRDDQVKIHGYRIELAEIQRAIEQAEGVEKAAVLVKNDQICAYVNPETVKEAEVKKYLAGRLPKYMVPSHIVVMDRFPLNKNGKLDRAALPDPFVAAAKPTDASKKVVAKTQMESLVTAAFRTVLNLSPNQQIYVTESFFDLGGSSLTVAILARHLSERTHVDISIIQVFDLKTVQEMAKYIDSQLTPVGGGGVKKESSYWKDAEGRAIIDKEGELTEKEKPLPGSLYNLMQFFSILIVSLIQVGPVIGSILAFRQLLFLTPLPFYVVIFMLPVVLYLAAIFNISLVIIAKWLMVGKLKAGIYPMYSYMFFKWWLNRKIMASHGFFLWIFTETPVYAFVMRRLGASIGTEAYMDMVDMEEPDLVTIGNQFIGMYECAICTSEVIENKLVLRNVELGHEVCMGKRAIVLPGTVVPNYIEICGGSAVDSNSPLQSGGQIWYGYPSKTTEARTQTNAMKLPGFFHNSFYHILQMLNIYALLFLLQWPFILLNEIAIKINNDINFIYVPGFIGMLGSLPVIISYMLMVIAAKWLLVGKVQANTVYTGWFFFLRRWIVDRLLLNPIFTYLQPTLFSYCSIGPNFWRLLGATVGPNTWMAPPMFDMGLNLVSFGEQPHMGQHNVFFTAVLSQEGVRFKSVTIGSHVTFGQRSIMSPGVKLGDRCTVGALTYLPEDYNLKENSTACGSPLIVFQTTLDTKGFTAQLQRMAKNELRKSSMERPSFLERPSMLASPRPSQIRGSVAGPRASSAGRASSATSDNSGNVKPLVYNPEARQSLFSDKIPEANQADEEHKVSSSSRCLFTLGVVLAKTLLPAIMAICYSYIFLAWRNYIIDIDNAVWLALFLPLTYLTGVILLVFVLAFLASVGLLNFRSGLMDYFSIGFFHWYIFTDILYGWVQMIMSPMSGTGLYVSWMQLMGADIGENCYIDIPGGLREVNNIIMQDNSVLLTRFIYAHYIDHGKLQFAPVVIGANVVINKECMIMPLTTYENCTNLRPYSSTIKGQVFSANRVYQGHPASKAFDIKGPGADVLVGNVTYTPMSGTRK